MPTNSVTTGSNTSNLQFNPIAQQLYNSLITGGGNVLSGYMNNPFGNTAYTIGAAQSQAGAQAAGNNNMQALQQNMKTSGIGGKTGQGFSAAQTAQMGRANQSLSSQANVQNVLAALQRQMGAAGTGLSFSPQLTGQSGTFNQNGSLGGAGSYSPLFSAGLGGLLSGLGNGLGSAAANPTAGMDPSGGYNGGLSQGTFNGIMGMSGMPSGGLAGQLPNTASNPFSPLMFQNQP